MTLTLPKPDDMHVHLRDGDALKVTVPATARQFARAIVMPNLEKPVTSVEMAKAYRERIMEHVPVGSNFEPLMTLYMSPEITADEIIKAQESEFVHAIKLYPQGATTNSEDGVKSLAGVFEQLEVMQSVGLPLLIHGESVGDDIDIFDRERDFIEQHLVHVVETFKDLKIVLEHITTSAAVDFVTASEGNIAATITPHHLMYNRNALLAGGIKPHHYCMPVLKREQHRLALIEAATSGNPKFFLGTDSAPHERATKESACGCAGIFSAPAALEIYAQVFDEAGALDKLPDFSSKFGAEFYGLNQNEGAVTLEPKEQSIPASIPYLDGEIIPMCAGETIAFTLFE